MTHWWMVKEVQYMKMQHMLASMAQRLLSHCPDEPGHEHPHRCLHCDHRIDACIAEESSVMRTVTAARALTLCVLAVRMLQKNVVMRVTLCRL